MIELNKPSIFEEVSFNLLMKKRIRHVLLICSKYDAFILEEDARVDEQIFMEYVSLNLRYPPQFIQANTASDAFNILETENIDLIINMLSVGEMDPYDLSFEIKARYPNKPIAVLTPFSRKVSLFLSNFDTSAIDYKFCWLGDSAILLAIIKLVEDNMNAEYDINEIGVQAILLVEDSIRYYSSYLPNIYRIIFQQSKELMTEGLNEHQKTLRMRGRPKILLANTYEKAIEIWEKYKNNILGVISDVSFEREGVKDQHAGIRLIKKFKEENKYMPVLMQSSDKSNQRYAEEINADFIHKYSKTLSLELQDFIEQHFTFGDFVFRDPSSGKEIERACDLKELQDKILNIPDLTVKFHINHNHFSRWLNARALFPLAKVFRAITSDDFENIEDIKHLIFSKIAEYRTEKSKGVISTFDKKQFDKYLSFSRIGDGSLGGKGRGIAFIDSFVKSNKIFRKFENVKIKIPNTLVLCTDIFDQFMKENKLYSIALSDKNDEVILKAFVEAELPKSIHKNLKDFIPVLDNPIAVRSSSLLEDSHYQPFAGVYSTFMLPIAKEEERMFTMLCNAIKSVYASVYYKESKAYMDATKNVIDEEKMGVVIQELCGTEHGNRFYPDVSGTARSLNYYPIEPEKAEDGIANIAFGLGKQTVEGGKILRFSPAYPQKVLQLSTPEMALRETQKKFFALDLNIDSYSPSINDDINLLHLSIKEAEKDNSLKHICSSYDLQNNIIREGTTAKGKKIVTFSNILKHNIFPLAEIIDTFLKVGQKEMNNPIEIEFAATINPTNPEKNIFSILQIRPIIDTEEGADIKLGEIKEKESIIISKSALGHGEFKDLHDIIYVKPEAFDSLKTKDIIGSIDKLNKELAAQERNFILIGPGRWGSSDPHLGIPVKWANISAAKVIIESGLDNYRIDPSQGTHFFQNLTSFRVCYFTINPYINDGYYDLDHLAGQDAIYEDKYIRHIRFDEAIVVKADGKKNIGVVYK